MKVERVILFLFISFSAIAASAQKSERSGRVISTDSLPLQAVITFQKADSTVIKKMITDSAGYFQYPSMKEGHFLLRAEVLGYTTQIIPFEIKAGAYSLPKNIVLTQDLNTLESVTVSAKKPAVVIKPDTLEYNARSVKLGADATTEDIFQKLPGLEVSKDGSIKANGEPVTQIYVDGKPFFGTDLKAVTQNFPADMIEKIQVINKKSDRPNNDDGSYEKIINITLKKNRKKGLFGNNTLGYGTAGRYDAKTSTNYLHYDTKLSIIGNASNINFNNGSSDANAPGDMKNTGLKMSFATSTKKADISTWASFDHTTNNIVQQLYRKNTYGDSASNYAEQNNSYSNSKSVNTGLYIEYKPDSFSVIKVNESAGFGKSNFDNGSLFETRSQNHYFINNGTSSAVGDNTASWLYGNISYNRRLGYNGRNINIDFSNRLNNNEGLLYNTYINLYYTDSSFDLYQDRFADQQNNARGFVATAAYDEPLTTKSSLGVSYTWNYYNTDLPKNMYAYNAVTGMYDSILPSFSSHFNNANNAGTASLTYNYGTKKTGFSIGVRWKHATLNSNAPDKDSAYNTGFKGLLPNFSFFSNKKKFTLNVDYYMYVKAPDALQLQPVIDNSNPLYLQLGNPDLKYTVIQTLRYKCNWYSTKKETGVNARASFSMLSDNISNNLVYDAATGKQVASPINTDGAYNWNAWLLFYKPFYIGDNKIKWNINLSGSGYSISNLLNGELNIATYNMLKVLTGLLYDAKSWIDLRTNISYARQINQYSIQHNVDIATNYIMINPVITIRPTETTEINLDYDHRTVSSSEGSLNNNVNLLNANIKQYVNEKKAIAISLKAFDLFNDNNNSVNSFGDNYIQDINSNSLTRYLLLSVSFRLQHFN